MTRIGKIYLYSFVAIIVIVVTSDKGWAQEEVANPDWTTGLWMAAPGAIMGLVNLALVSRLSSPSNRGGIFDGFSRFFPGLSPEGQKKMMLFMGKHNIQVSNHKDRYALIKNIFFSINLIPCSNYCLVVHKIIVSKS